MFSKRSDIADRDVPGKTNWQDRAIATERGVRVDAGPATPVAERPVEDEEVLIVSTVRMVVSSLTLTTREVEGLRDVLELTWCVPPS